MSTEARRASHPPRPTVPPGDHPAPASGTAPDHPESPRPPATPPPPAHAPSRPATPPPAASEAPSRPRPAAAWGPGSAIPATETAEGSGTPSSPSPATASPTASVSGTAALPGAPERPRTPPRPAAPPRPSRAPAPQDTAGAPRRPSDGPPAPLQGTDGTSGRTSSDPGNSGRAQPRYPRFRLDDPSGGPQNVPPPRASARFPDAPPSLGREPAPRASARFPDAPPVVGGGAASRPGTSPAAPAAPRAGAVPDAATARGPGAPAEIPSETTRRLRPVPAEPGDAGSRPDPALSWSAPAAPGDGRPRVSFARPEGYDGLARPRPLGGRLRPQALAAAVCLVLGVGLLTGAVTGSWLAGDSGDGGAGGAFTEAGDLWHSVPVDQLFPPTVNGQGAGPGGADRTWTRVAVAPDADCAAAFDRLLAKVLDPVGCRRLLRATYTDATRSHVTTVGMLFTKADAAAMTSLAKRFETEGLGGRDDLMPLPYAAKDTAAAGFGARQRAAWTVSVLTDAPVVVYAVSGWADARTVDDPQPAGEAMESGATSAPAQAGLGHEAKGLADRVERALRKNVGPATEHPS
ncbi:hypothetical protein ABTX71_16285 [Streptomyces parvulus]|uniref:hypothetical protein n=1 Tax=Streptomyces parvulus TaxID=146923 RepID=UPI003321C140